MSHSMDHTHSSQEFDRSLGAVRKLQVPDSQSSSRMGRDSSDDEQPQRRRKKGHKQRGRIELEMSHEEEGPITKEPESKRSAWVDLLAVSRSNGTAIILAVTGLIAAAVVGYLLYRRFFVRRTDAAAGPHLTFDDIVQPRISAFGAPAVVRAERAPAPAATERAERARAPAAAAVERAERARAAAVAVEPAPDVEKARSIAAFFIEHTKSLDEKTRLSVLDRMKADIQKYISDACTKEEEAFEEETEVEMDDEIRAEAERVRQKPSRRGIVVTPEEKTRPVGALVLPADDPPGK
jgi:hypothetical protein